MRDQHELDRALHALYEDAPELPADVLRRALDEAAATRQRRYGWLPVLPVGTVRGWAMLLGPAATAVVVVVIGLVVIGLLATGPEPPVGPAMPTASPERSPLPSASPAASTIVVSEDGSGDVTTIAEAVALAADGDTIRIRPGTYVAGVTVTTDVTIAGDGPRDEIVVIASDTTPTIELEDTYGYAFLTQDSDATIRDLTLRNAGALRFAPVVAAGGAPTLERLDAGGTIWLIDGSDAIVRDNRIHGISMSGELGEPRIEENDTTAARSVVEGTLAERLPALACEPWREEGDEPFTFGATGAIRCHEPAADMRQLALFAFPDEATLGRYWRWRMEDLGLDTVDVGLACDDDPGVRPWQHGSVACYISDDAGGIAKIRWTDERDLTYGVIDASGPDAGSLFRRWQERFDD